MSGPSTCAPGFHSSSLILSILFLESYSVYTLSIAFAVSAALISHGLLLSCFLTLVLLQLHGVSVSIAPK